MTSLTTQTQIAVEWTASAATQNPGGLVQGYILSMFDPQTGLWTEVFNGERGFPNIRSFIVKKNIKAGLPYKFKVKAAYKNGYTDESISDTIYSCTSPIELAAPQFVSATATTMTL